MPKLLDRSFGDRGRVITHIGDPSALTFSGVLALAFLEGGRIAAAGKQNEFADNTYHGSLALVHYLPNGSVDATFGSNGQVVAPFAGFVSAAAFQKGGKILVIGDTDPETNIVTSRYNPDGSPDTGFGSSGTASIQIGTEGVTAEALAIQDDGKIVVVGNFGLTGPVEIVLIRYNSNGSLDPSFGAGGIVRAAFGNSGSGIQAVAIQKDGKLVVAGQQANSLAVLRYQPNGSVDTAFGTNGMVTTHVGTFSVIATGVAIQRDGKIVVAGYVDSEQTLVARYKPDGSPDPTFGDNGTVTTKLTRFGSAAMSLLIQPDGSLITAGWMVTLITFPGSTSTDFGIVRFLPDGRIDRRFLRSARHVKSTSEVAAAFTVGMQPDGKLVAAGETDAVGVPGIPFELIRYRVPGSGRGGRRTRGGRLRAGRRGRRQRRLWRWRRARFRR